jgi:hypothetical protein
MGDLANVIDYANTLNANSPIKGECKWNNSLYDVDMSYRN